MNPSMYTAKILFDILGFHSHQVLPILPNHVKPSVVRKKSLPGANNEGSPQQKTHKIHTTNPGPQNPQKKTDVGTNTPLKINMERDGTGKIPCKPSILGVQLQNVFFFPAGNLPEKLPPMNAMIGETPPLRGTVQRLLPHQQSCIPAGNLPGFQGTCRVRIIFSTFTRDNIGEY